MSHLYQQLVHFVANDCDWPIESQAQGSGLNETTIRKWLNGQAQPRPLNLASWVTWACDECESALFNPFGSRAGRWVRERAADTLAIAPGWSAYALLGSERWALVCMWRGELEEVEIGEWPRGWSDTELLDALAANVRLLCQGRGIHRELPRDEIRRLEQLRIPTPADYESARP